MAEAPQFQAQFNRVAGIYDRHAALEQEVCKRLLERTAYLRAEPRHILDLGCGTGGGSASLKKAFRKSRVVGLDFSPAMLAQLQRKSSLLRRLVPVCADMDRLPLADASVDLVFSNLANYWSRSPTTLYAEIRRVLRPDGMFLFSTLGPETYEQLRLAWAGLDDAAQLPIFADVLEVGDALAAAGFEQPTMDVDRITLEYRSLETLMSELEATGASLLVRGWHSDASVQERLAAAWPRLGGARTYPLGFEIIYGAAFAPATPERRIIQDPDVVSISVDSLLKSRPLAMMRKGKQQNS